jgi:parallel beta-helix repeat protein
MALALAGIVSAGPAQAAHVGCGSVITQSTTLDSNVGPCPGNGLVVTASNIVVNLNGFTVSGANGSGDTVGIRLVNVSGVTVMNGTVRGFDEGIGIFGGFRNSVRGVTARDNVNDFLSPPCDLGDGIGLFDSSSNSIDANTVVHNGPYGGISVVGNSDGNRVAGNTVLDNNISSPNGSGCGNNRQDEGVRLEGPGANNNAVQGNTVRGSLLAGISVHSADLEGGDQPNNLNAILGNTVQQNGYASTGDGPGGISLIPNGPGPNRAFGTTISGNTSTNNTGDGILIAEESHDDVVQGNVVNNNTRDGLAVLGPYQGRGLGAHDNTLTNNRGSGNARWDGSDGNLAPPCDNNHWSGNQFVKVNQPCVAANGGTGTATLTTAAEGPSAQSAATTTLTVGNDSRTRR